MDENVSGAHAPRLGFIGFGEAAFNIAAGLCKEGLTGISAHDKFLQDEAAGALIRQRAAQAGVALCETLEALSGCSDIIISSVNSSVAVRVAQDCARYLRPGQLYVDLNSTAPDKKEQSAQAIAGTGARFVDCAVMGTVPGLGHKVPMLLAGAGAHEFERLLMPFGMMLMTVSDKEGTASASKMLRSIFMKGVVALLTETVVAGRLYGLEDELLDSIGETFSGGPFRDIAGSLIARGSIHAARRAHEMEEVVAMLEQLGVDGTMSRATRQKLEWCAKLDFKGYFKGVAPVDYHDIFAVLDQRAAQAG